MVSQRNLYFGQEWNLSCALVTAHLNTVHKLVVLCTLSSRSFWETEWYSFKVPPATGLALFFAAFTEPEPTPFKGHFNEITLSVIYQPLCEIFCLFILFMGFSREVRWFAIPSSSGPHFVRTLHHDPSVLGGSTWQGPLRDHFLIHQKRFKYAKKSDNGPKLTTQRKFQGKSFGDSQTFPGSLRIQE